MFGGPHVGIHKEPGKDGKVLWGKVARPHQGHITGSCGSLTGCLAGFVKGNKPRAFDVQSGMDF